jgi:hypothetical protein
MDMQNSQTNTIVSTHKMMQAYNSNQPPLRPNSQPTKVTNQQTEAQELLNQVRKSTQQCKNPSHLGTYVDSQA